MEPIRGYELTGHRQAADGLVGRMAAGRLVDVWRGCTSRVVKHGFVLEYRDLEPPRTGIFDGLRIVLDPDVGFEMQCFVLLHLFGHSVQWVAPSLEAKLHDLQHEKEHRRFMQVLHAYEFDAARYGLTLLHEAGIADLDQWYADFVETDWRYVERYYESGVIPPWEECVARGCSLVAPLPIPPLVHRQVDVRFAF